MSQCRSPGEPLHSERLDPLVVQIFRRRTPAERCERMLELNGLIREGVTARLSDQHCAGPPERVLRELLRRRKFETLADFFARADHSHSESPCSTAAADSLSTG